MRKNNNKLFTIEFEPEKAYDYFESFFASGSEEMIIVEGLIQLAEQMVANVMNGADPIVEINHVILCLEVVLGTVLTDEQARYLSDILVQILRDNGIDIIM